MPECDQVPILELLRGELPVPRCEEVLEHLSGCPRCRERAKLMGLLELEPPRLELRPARSSEEKGSKGNLRRLLPLAAALLLAAGVLASWFLIPRSPGPGAEVPPLEPYPWDPTLTRETPEAAGAEQLRVAAELYRQQRYAEAAAVLQDLPSTPTSDFYLALCWLLSGRDAPAARLLEGLTAGESPWSEPARWYLAHVYFRQADRAAALRELEILSQRPGAYQEAAKDWLSRLRQAPGESALPDSDAP
ncbi:MAG: hypothetical protein Kow00109_19430 [Acidobacteriota bacterium]